MQSLDYKLKTSNTSYVTARHDVQYFASSLSSFSPTTSRVCRIPLTSGTSFIDPESIKIAFRVRNTDGTNPLAPATPNPACFVLIFFSWKPGPVRSFYRKGEANSKHLLYISVQSLMTYRSQNSYRYKT